LELDFAEEDVEFANREKLLSLVGEIRSVTGKLLRSFALGNVLKEGVITVIAGRPNAGKSTMLNALLNEERALVSEFPGTTRDSIEEVLNIGGVLFRLIDTAGIRNATDVIEKAGVERTHEKIATSAIVVYVADASAMDFEEVQKDIQILLPANVPVVVAVNKWDLQEKKLEPSRLRFPHVEMSAKRNEGLEELKNLLTSQLPAGENGMENTMITNLRHVEALQEADAALAEVEAGVHQKVSGEMVALDIRQVLDHLGAITGEVSSDELLGNIFSRFCIGK